MNGRTLRRLLRPVPTSVSVVCTLRGATPVGHTIGTFVSVSLDPPLVGYPAAAGSGTLAAVRAAGVFTVNVLAAHQGGLAVRFAQRSGDPPGPAGRFAEVAWRPGANGCPHLPGALTVLECGLHDVVGAGDHELVLGRVTAATAATAGARPLVFAGGAFTTTATVAPGALAAPGWERAG